MYADARTQLPPPQRRHPEDLAARVGLNQTQIRRYEKGAAEPSMSGLKRRAFALGVTIDELVFDEGERGTGRCAPSTRLCRDRG